MSNKFNEKLAKIFESFNDDCIFLSNSEAETYGITIWDYAQKHPNEVLNNYLNECLKCYEELVERIQACEDKIKDYDFHVDENTPTVEVIPISIIKEELEYARKMYNNSTELTEPYWRGSISALEILIIRWEKENETKIDRC